MPYSTEIATVLARQLAKFATLNRHQIVGHLANLDFWLDEIRHCLAVLDGYGPRFERMKAAQTQYVSEHQTVAFFPDEPDLASPAPQPQKMYKARVSRSSPFAMRCHLSVSSAMPP